MSSIIIYVYDGDSYEYEHHEDNAGDRVADSMEHFSDGEELNAVGRIVELLSQGKHFDVRQEWD